MKKMPGIIPNESISLNSPAISTNFLLFFDNQKIIVCKVRVTNTGYTRTNYQVHNYLYLRNPLIAQLIK